MKLTRAQIEDYERNGFLVLPGVVSLERIDELLFESVALCSTDSPARILEREGQPSSVYATDRSPAFKRLARLPELIEPARQLLGGEIYAHQIKLNPKVAFHGTFVDWHRDFVFWRELDGMPSPRALTVAVFLEDVDAYNAPLLFVAGSHQTGEQHHGPDNAVGTADTSSAVGSWLNVEMSGESTLVGKLKYTEHGPAIEEPIVAATAARGAVALFHSNLIHGSNHNMSPRDRYIAFVTYNSVGNPLRAVPRPRPSFIANRDFTPLRALGEEDRGR